jgi:prevent-host-death family protein
LYKTGMSAKPLAISEARRRLSALVERVARGAAPIAIGRYGSERAVLVGADEYARLTRRTRTGTERPGSLEGTLSLVCSPEELIAERRRLGELWLAGGARPNPNRLRSKRQR